MSGVLYVVSTPIGNLGDISRRAIEILSTVHAVACEDTRHSGRLLQHIGARPERLLRCDAHAERRAAGDVIDLLASGADVAVISDAGTPGVSDPGAALIQLVIEAGFEVIPIPGASAALAALVVSGLPTERFVVEGFLPRKGRERAARLAEIVAETRTVVIYESPKRLHATLVELDGLCAEDRRASVSRELTKLHEETARGTFADLADHFDDTVKGEIVVVIGPAAAPGPATIQDVALRLEAKAASGVDRRTAVAEVMAELAAPKRLVYDASLVIEWPERS